MALRRREIAVHTGAWRRGRLLAIGFTIVGSALAGDYKGKVKSIDASAKTLTIETKDDGDKVLKFNGDSKIVGGKGEMTFEKLGEFMAKAKEKAKDADPSKKGGRGGMNVTVTTTGEGAKEVISEVKMATRMKKKAD